MHELKETPQVLPRMSMAATADSPSVLITVGEIRNGKGLHLLVMIQ